MSVANPSTPKEDEDEDDSHVAAGGGGGGVVEDRLRLHKQSPWCSSPSAFPSSSNTDSAPWNCDSTRQRRSPSPQRQKAVPSIGFGTGSVVLCSSAEPSPP